MADDAQAHVVLRVLVLIDKTMQALDLQRQPPKVQKPCTAVCKQSVNGKKHHQRKKRAIVLIARFLLLYWCRKEESNPRPSHYE